MVFVVALAAIMSACARPRPVPVENRYTSAMFIRALQNSSTAPDFVLITVVDARDASARVVCISTPSLKGALHTEFGIPYDEAGERRVHELALKQSDRVFRFSKPDALRSVQIWYTQADLDAVRSMLVDRPDGDLLNYEFVQSLYMNHFSRNKRGRYQDAVAHALLERGIGCRRGCVEADLNPYK
jgi:hypothetical protein